MMGDPELVKQVEREELGPLISPDGLEQLQGKYVQSVRVRITIGFLFTFKFFFLLIVEFLENWFKRKTKIFFFSL